MKWTYGIAASITLGLLCCVSCGGTLEIGVLPSTDLPTGPAIATAQNSVETRTQGPTVALTAAGDALTPTLPATDNPTATNEATKTAATITPCVAPVKWVPYTVKPGDTLFDLSQRTNVSIQQLQRANCTTSATLRAGQQLYLPFIPTPTSTATATSTLTPVPPTVDPLAVWSPDGQRYATPAGVVVDVAAGHVAAGLFNPAALSVWSWTADSRYVIFGRKNQFNSTYTYVFDAASWRTVYSTNGCALLPDSSTLTDYCGDFPLALSPAAPRFVMENGSLVDLTTLQTTDLLAAWRPAKLLLTQASWSPDGIYLAWTAANAKQSQFNLYLASGEGAAVQLVTDLDGSPGVLAWLSATTVRVTTAASRYTLDAVTGRLDIQSLLTATPPPSASPTASPTP